MSLSKVHPLHGRLGLILGDPGHEIKFAIQQDRPITGEEFNVIRAELADALKTIFAKHSLGVSLDAKSE